MREAPDYTNAALVMGLVNLIMFLATIWVMFGLPAVLAAGFGLNILITKLSGR